MSRSEESFARMYGRVFDRHGWDAVHTPKTGGAVTRRACVHRDLQRVGENLVTAQRRTEIELLVSEGPEPQRGDTIRIVRTDALYRWDAVISNNGHVIRGAVR